MNSERNSLGYGVAPVLSLDSRHFYLRTNLLMALVICLVSVWSSISSAQVICSQVFKIQNDFELFQELEATLQQRQKELLSLSADYQSDPKVLQEFERRLKIFSEIVEQVEFILLNGESGVADQMIQMSKDLSKTSYESIKAELQVPRAKVLHWNDYVIDPSLLVPDIEYQVPQRYGSAGSLAVIFDQGLLTQVVQSNDLVAIDAFRKTLSALQNGVFGWSYKGDGIIRKVEDNNIVKVRITGRNVGKHRFYGYLYKYKLYMVAWSEDSKHDSRQIGRMVRLVQEIRSKRHP